MSRSKSRSPRSVSPHERIDIIVCGSRGHDRLGRKDKAFFSDRESTAPASRPDPPRGSGQARCIPSAAARDWLEPRRATAAPSSRRDRPEGSDNSQRACRAARRAATNRSASSLHGVGVDLEHLFLSCRAPTLGPRCRPPPARARTTRARDRSAQPVGPSTRSTPRQFPDGTIPTSRIHILARDEGAQRAPNPHHLGLYFPPSGVIAA